MPLHAESRAGGDRGILQIKHVHGSGNAGCVDRRLCGLSLQPHVGEVHGEAHRRKQEDSENQHKKNGGLSDSPSATSRQARCC